LEDKAEIQEITSKIPENLQKLREIFKREYTNEILKSKNLQLQSTYTYLEKLTEEERFVEIGRIGSNGIYDFLFKVLNVQKSGENKNILITVIWL
jgi:CRISPR-associated protein dxTHG motif protein